MGAIVLPFLWAAQALGIVCAVMIVVVFAVLCDQGNFIAAILFAAFLAFILFAWWYWGA